MRIKAFLLAATLPVMGLIYPVCLPAQVSQGGVPASFYDTGAALRTADLQAEPRVHTFAPDVNPQDFLARASWQAGQGAPVSVGKPVPASLDLERDGELITLQDGTAVRRLLISAPESKAIVLYYARFFIPAGGKLFIYSPDKTQVLGAYTTQTNPSGGIFATQEIAGSDAVLEYQYPADGRPAQVQISHIGMIFLPLNHLNGAVNPNELREATGENAAESCYVNINCPEGADWQKEKDGLVHILVYSEEGMSYCSGAVVNNAREDFTPYILTAAHCSTRRPENFNVPHTADEFARYIFYFHYEKSACTAPDIAKRHVQSLVGAHLCAWIDQEGKSDGELLRLITPIPLQYGVYYNGWSRSNAPSPRSGVGLHFPMADALKVSTFTEPAQTKNWEGAKENAHWNVLFTTTQSGAGATAAGSSGSPLFDQDHRIRATLTGGNSSCTHLDGTNVYGKLGYHWDYFKEDGKDPTLYMAYYLDPENTGLTSIDGKYQTPQYPAPARFESFFDGTNVRLAWRAPISAATGLNETPTHYVLTRDGLEIATPAAGDTTYVDVPAGRGKVHTYLLTAVYGSEPEQTSAPQKSQVFCTPDEELAVSSFNKSAEQGGVTLTWQPPVMRQTISNARHYQEANSVRFLSFPGDQSLCLAHAWSPSELKPISDCYITRIGLQIVTDTIPYYLMLRQGQNFYKQEIKKTWRSAQDEIQWVSLDKPFPVNSSAELYVGYGLFGIQGPDDLLPGTLDFDCVSVDNGPCLDGGGNLMSPDFEEFSTLTVSMNFTLQAEVSTLPYKTQAFTSVPLLQPDAVLQKPSPYPAVTGYEVYKNGTRVATLPMQDRSYTDKDGNASDEYLVKPLFGYGLNVSVEEITPAHQAWQAVWDASAGAIRLADAPAFTAAYLFDAQGKQLGLTAYGAYLHTAPLAPGVYLLTLSLPNGDVQSVRVLVP